MATDFLGCTVKDLISGYSGIATQAIRFISGNYQVAIQPKVREDGTLPECITMDTHNLEKVDDVMVNRVTPPVFTVDVILGNKVEDLATGFTGIAAQELIHMNGCVFYLVLPKHNPESLWQSAPEGTWIPMIRIKVVDDGILGETTKVVDNQDVATPGGPSVKLPTRTKAIR